jgi:hypothetical protein
LTGRSAYLDVLSLGCLRPRAEPAAALAGLRGWDPEEATRIFIRHKIRQAVLPQLEAQPELAEHAAALRVHTERTREVIARRGEAEALIDSHARALGAPVERIKGLALIDLYPEGTFRDINDLDIYVRDVEVAWRLAEALLADGYVYRRDELPWIKGREHGQRLYGQIQVQRQMSLTLSSIDIHFGCYSVRHASHLDIPVGAEPGLGSVDQTVNTPLLIANTAGDHFVTVKDVNDIVLLLADETIDWDEVQRQLHAAGLGGFFNVVLDKVDELCDLREGERQKLGSLRMSAPAEAAPPWESAEWGQRWRATTVHALRAGLRRSPVEGLRLAAGAARYYRRPLKLHSGRVLRPPRLDRERLRSDRCWRLVPADMAVELAPASAGGGASGGGASSDPPPATAEFAGPLRRVRTADGDLIVRDGEVFVPTVMYSVPPALVARAAALAR